MNEYLNSFSVFFSTYTYYLSLSLYLYPSLKLSISLSLSLSTVTQVINVLGSDPLAKAVMFACVISDGGVVVVLVVV